MQQQIGEIIRRHLVPSENYIYGFADLTGLLDKKFSGFNYGISIGKKLDYSIVRRITGGPTRELFDPWKYRNQCAEFGRTRLSMKARVCGMCITAFAIGFTE
jgi:hypothetical protein